MTPTGTPKRPVQHSTAGRGKVVTRGALGALAVALVVAGTAALIHLNTRSPSPTGRATTAPSGSASARPATATAPLTGLPVDDPATLNRPAVAIKVSNVRSAHPQLGVDRADLVFCEPIGPRYTRLAAVFHSQLPDRVGPVRSARPMDAALLSPLNPVFGHTMAARWVMTYLRSTGRLDSLGSLQVPHSSGAYRVEPGRPRPDNVFARPSTLLELARTATAPRPYFRYAADAGSASAVSGSAASGSAAGRVVVSYGAGWDVQWTFDPRRGEYLRREPWGAHVMADGVQVHAVNVLVLVVDSKIQKLADGVGAPVPVLQLENAEGSMVAVAGGRVIRGTWAKGGVDEPFELRTETGEPLLLAPGNTWVELPAVPATVTTG